MALRAFDLASKQAHPHPIWWNVMAQKATERAYLIMLSRVVPEFFRRAGTTFIFFYFLRERLFLITAGRKEKESCCFVSSKNG